MNTRKLTLAIAAALLAAASGCAQRQIAQQPQDKEQERDAQLDERKKSDDLLRLAEVAGKDKKAEELEPAKHRADAPKPLDGGRANEVSKQAAAVREAPASITVSGTVAVAPPPPPRPRTASTGSRRTGRATRSTKTTPCTASPRTRSAPSASTSTPAPTRTRAA